MVLYKLYLESYGYSFWCYDQEGVLACKELVEQISATFTDRPLYINERFGFSFELLMDYKMEQMPSGEGAIQKKWFEEDGYAVQISVYAEDNIMEYQDALALYRDKYEGFDSDFGEVDGKTAVYVNEGQGNDAVRHMIMMSRDGSTIIRAELRVPSFYFTRHKEEFDEFTRKIKAD